MFDRGDAIALVYSTVMRNLSIALAMALTVFGGDEGAEICHQLLLWLTSFRCSQPPGT